MHGCMAVRPMSSRCAQVYDLGFRVVRPATCLDFITVAVADVRVGQSATLTLGFGHAGCLSTTSFASDPT